MKNSKWVVLIGISISTFLGCLDFTIVNTILPAIQKNLGASVTQLQWVINIFILNLCAFMVIMGRLADLYGRRLVFYVGMIAFTLSSLGASLSPTINILLLFRFLQGTSTAILYAVSGGIITSTFPEKEHTKALGILFGVNGIGLSIGPVLGGVIEGLSSWRWVFLINVPIMIISLLFCIPSLKESKNREHGSKIDWWGVLLLITSLGPLVIALVNGEHWGWGSVYSIVLFAITLVSLIAFYFVEKKSKSPIIKLDLFLNRLFLTSVSAQFFMAFFYTLAFFVMPLYLHLILGFKGVLLGVMLLPTTAVMALCSPFLSHAVTTFGPKRFISVGFLCLALSAVVQSIFTTSTPLWLICVGFALLGLGWGLILNPSTASAISSVPPAVSSVAMGSLWTFHNIGGAIGLSVGTVVYHYISKQFLIHTFPAKASSWIGQAVARPEIGAQLIEKNTSTSAAEALSLINSSFLSGYHATMILLIITSIIAFLIHFAMPSKPTTVEVEADPLGEVKISKLSKK